jgi:hypothetical protein
MRIVTTLALLAAIVGGIAGTSLSASAFTCSTTYNYQTHCGR